MRKLDKFNKMIAMGAFCVGAAATLMGCGDNNNQDASKISNYSPGEEEPETIYGPPEMMDSEAGEETTSSSEGPGQTEEDVTEAATEITTETTEESVKTTEQINSSETSEEQESSSTESPASGNEVRTVSNSTQSKKTKKKKSTSERKTKKKSKKKTTEKKKDKKTEEKTTEATTTQAEAEEAKPREYDPRREEANILYGPPPSDNIITPEPKKDTPTEETTEKTTETPAISDYDPKDDLKALTDLYGPPPTR